MLQNWMAITKTSDHLHVQLYCLSRTREIGQMLKLYDYPEFIYRRDRIYPIRNSHMHCTGHCIFVNIYTLPVLCDPPSSPDHQSFPPTVPRTLSFEPPPGIISPRTHLELIYPPILAIDIVLNVPPFPRRRINQPRYRWEWEYVRRSQSGILYIVNVYIVPAHGLYIATQIFISLTSQI